MEGTEVIVASLLHQFCADDIQFFTCVHRLAANLLSMLWSIQWQEWQMLCHR